MAKNKYRNIKTEVDGIKFDSKAEAKRYGELKQLLAAKEIFNLKIHPQFVLHVDGIKIGKYIADSLYNKEGGEMVVEDVKGMQTQIFRWKKRHMKAQYGIVIQIITGKKSK